MGLFDIFTGRPQRQASQQIQQYIGNLSNQVGALGNQALQTGLGALTSAQQQALPIVQAGTQQAREDLLGTSGAGVNALQGTAGQALGALGAGAAGAQGALTGGYGAARDVLGQYTGQGLEALQSGMAGALGAYDPLAAAGARYGGEQQATAQMYADALGLNGPEGTARAQGAFQAGPGYQWQLGQGLEAINRARNAAGGLASGNTDIEALRYGQGLAGQEYGNWLGRLAGREGLYLNPELQALSGVASGRAGAYGTGSRAIADLLAATGGNMANLFTGEGRGIADILAGLGRGEADIFTGLGRNEANLWGQLGTNLANVGTQGAGREAGILTGTGQNISNLAQGVFGPQTSFLGSTLSPYSNAVMGAANAQAQGAGNLWGLLGNLATAGVGGLGGLGGLGSLLAGTTGPATFNPGGSAFSY